LETKLTTAAATGAATAALQQKLAAAQQQQAQLQVQFEAADAAREAEAERLEEEDRQLAERQRRVLLGSRLMGVRGRVQRQGDVLHVVAMHLEDHSALLGEVPARSRDFS
jgi:hypothetical protein